MLLRCTALCTVLLMRVHCAADKEARRPLDEKVAKNFYKSPHLRNTSKQPTMKKIYKRYITKSRISHINWILLIKQRCPGAWVIPTGYGRGGVLDFTEPLNHLKAV